MISPSAARDLAAFYLSLSRLGRRTLRGLRRRGSGLGSGDAAIVTEALGDRRRRAGLLAAFRACDAVFGRAVTPDACREAGRDRAATYARYVPFAWIGVLLRSRFLEAFGIAHGREALERAALLTFIHREWNDLLERVPIAELLATVGDQDSRPDRVPRPLGELRSRFRAFRDPGRGTPSEQAILTRMIRLLDEALPRPLFEAFAGLLKPVFAYMETAEIRDTTGVDRKAVIAQAVRLSFRVMVEDLPPAADAALGPLADWFYGLDDLADKDRDREAGRKTVMTIEADPIARIEALYGAAEASIVASAPDPETVLALMRNLTAHVVSARRDGRQVEREDFHAES